MPEPPLYRPAAHVTLVEIRDDPFLTAVCRWCGHRHPRLILADYRGVPARTGVRFVERRLRCQNCGKRGQAMLLAQAIVKPVRDFRLSI